MLNRDYKDILQSLVDEDVKFLLVGAYAQSLEDLIRNKKASGRTKDLVLILPFFYSLSIIF